MRLVRTTMLEVLRSDYVRTAQAKGLRQRTVIVSHALRNASTPILTAVGTAFIAVFGGSVIAERDPQHQRRRAVVLHSRRSAATCR